MKKFIAILVLLSVCSFADTRYKNTCDNPVIRKELKIANSEAFTKADDDFTFIFASCVNSNYEAIYVVSDKLLKTSKTLSNSDRKYLLCFTENSAPRKLIFSSASKLTLRLLDKDFIERDRISATFNECKKLISGFKYQ
ncbi:hypothetical protein KDD93_01210 [Campylobacter sp. faydin G-24]|uniref:Uncharacterized protein n=1 Tax=Campylobacter anatolicus TaxID=2829105 RepID=A0ABS5HFZ6_9BACT|nr:hypothetical protein [Campylobacter anatolicus]MBR8462355.1 hypothetical protein [Campylobacter anatolicus]MBR8463193.1 hypothetical protein [Campylobacter anatolicus]